MTTPGTQGEVSPESIGKTASSAVRSPAHAKPAPSPHYWEHCGPKSAPCRGKPFDLWNELELERKKGDPGLEVFNFPVQAILIRRADCRCRYSRWAALHG